MVSFSLKLKDAIFKWYPLFYSPYTSELLSSKAFWMWNICHAVYNKCFISVCLFLTYCIGILKYSFKLLISCSLYQYNISTYLPITTFFTILMKRIIRTKFWRSITIFWEITFRNNISTKSCNFSYLKKKNHYRKLILYTFKNRETILIMNS